MANIKVPNLCGANAEFNAVQSKFESLLSDAVDGLESAASSLASTLDSAATSLTTDLRDLIPEVPSLPDVSLQSLLTSLSSLTPGTSEYITLLNKIKTDFETELTAAGKSLDTLVSNARTQIEGGGDLCSVVPNFVKAADGLTDAKEKSPESKQPNVDAAEEKTSTLVKNAEIVAQRTGLGLRVKKMITETSTAEDVVADTVTSTTLPTEDVGAFEVTSKSIEIVSTDGLKVEATSAKEAVVKTTETVETSGARVTKTERANVSAEGFSSRKRLMLEKILKLTNNSVTLKYAPTSIIRILGYYSDDNKKGRNLPIDSFHQDRSGYDIIHLKDQVKNWKGDTYTINGKVLTITQDKSGPYEGIPDGTTKDWLKKYPTGTILKVVYQYNDTYDPRFVKK